MTPTLSVTGVGCKPLSCAINETACLAPRRGQQWQTRLGLLLDPQWTAVLERLTKPLVRNGIYAVVGTEPYTYRDDHPSMLMALGFVPGTPLIERDIMSATYDDVLANWDWFTTWGWDFPVLAMCATRLVRPHDAVMIVALLTHQK